MFTAFPRNLVVLTAAAVVICFTGLIRAQPAADAGPLAPLKKKAEALTTDEQNIVDQWLGRQLDALATAVIRPVGRSNPASRPRQIRQAIIANATGSPPYRAVYVTRLAQRVRDRVGKQDVHVAINNMIILVKLGDPALADAYAAGLNAKGLATNLLALQGLQKARSKLSPQAIAKTSAQATELAQARGDDVLLEWVYRFVDYPDNESCRARLVQLLQWRGAAYAQAPPLAQTSDTVLIGAVGRAYASASAAQQKQLVSGLAVILKSVAETDIQTKVTPATERRRRVLAFVAHAAEGALAAITNENTNRPVTGALGARNAQAARAALVGWLGDKSTQGVLNNAPYDLKPMIDQGDTEAGEKKR